MKLMKDAGARQYRIVDILLLSILLNFIVSNKMLKIVLITTYLMFY